MSTCAPRSIAAGYTQQQAQRIRFWYDPSEIVARPNRNVDAATAYDRYALSSRAFREALGFNEDDAPSTSEILLRMLNQKGPISPELAESLMRVLAPAMMEAARGAAAEASDNPLPGEVNDILGFETTPAPETATSEEDGEPLPPEPEFFTPPGAPAPANPSAPPSPQGPRAATPAAQGPSDQIPGLPPTPRS